MRISSSLYRWCNELYRESREQKPFYNTDSRLLANRSSSSVHRPPRLFSRSCPPFSPLHPCRIEGSVFSKSSDYPRGMGYIIIRGILAAFRKFNEKLRGKLFQARIPGHPLLLLLGRVSRHLSFPTVQSNTAARANGKMDA